MGTKPFRRQERWSPQPLTPLMEGLEAELQEEGDNKTDRSWEFIRKWFRLQKVSPSESIHSVGNNVNVYDDKITTKQDLRLLLGVLGCPLAPIPLPPVVDRSCQDSVHRIYVKSAPIENCMAHYIIQQYLAATGCLKQQQGDQKRVPKNMYATGVVKMIRCETEISTGKNVKILGARSGESSSCGRFVVWQMTPGMWSLELVVARNHKVLAGSDGKTVWRHTPWLGTHVAKGPQRPLRRIIQGLDPKITASLFTEAQYLGEKRIGEEDCFVLKVSADHEAIIERSEGATEVLRHVLYGYFSTKSGLLIYLEDSHLTRVQITMDSPDRVGTTRYNETVSGEETRYIYWETTIGSGIEDYKEVEGVLIAHQGRSIATVFRFEEECEQHSRTRMEEFWMIDDVEFNVQGLSMDSFIPPADVLHANCP